MPTIKNPDPKRCYEAVWGDFRHHQCHRRGIIEAEGKRWCKQHSPEAVRARNEKRKAESEVKMAKWNYYSRLEVWQKSAPNIIKRIAEGHNDPRSLAQEYMAKEPKLKEIEQ
jgi:hypothetical protein